MSSKTAIEWTNMAWNPLTRCTRVTAGCEHCYAFTLHEARHQIYKEQNGVCPETLTHLPACTDRLAHVQIDHRDFEPVIRADDSPSTCFYLDPPYVLSSRRKGRCYHHETSEQDHKRLLRCLLHVEGMVLLSGYAHPLYEEALAS